MNLGLRQIAPGSYAIRTSFAQYRLEIRGEEGEEEIEVTGPGFYESAEREDFPESLRPLAIGLALIINAELSIQGE